MASRFSDQVVWITGGGSGLGRAMALEFARQGARVAVSGRRLDRLEEVVGLIEAVGPAKKGLAVACDVTSEDEVEAALQTVHDTLGRIDVVVANAGYAVSGRIESLSTEDWRRQFEVNVLGLVTTVRCALPHLRRTRGRIALIASVAAFIPGPGSGAYSASKAAVRSIGETLSAELGGTGVTCTTIHPGFVESEIAQVDNSGQHHPDREDRRPAALMWPADRAARVMIKAIHQRKQEFVFTGHGRFAAFLGQHMPGLTTRIMTLGEARKRKTLAGE